MWLFEEMESYPMYREYVYKERGNWNKNMGALGGGDLTTQCHQPDRLLCLTLSILSILSTLSGIYSESTNHTGVVCTRHFSNISPTFLSTPRRGCKFQNFRGLGRSQPHMSFFRLATSTPGPPGRDFFALNRTPRILRTDYSIPRPKSSQDSRRLSS